MINPIKILLVEDHKLIRVGIRTLFDEADEFLVVAEAENGKEAIEKVLKYAPDVVLLDIGLPDISGIKVFKALQDNDCNSKIIILSSHNSEDEIAKTLAMGAFAYIITIYIIKVFSDSFSLGIFTSIFSIITCIIGVLFAKCIKKEHYASAIKITMTFTVISLCLMIFKCTAVTIVLFNLFQTISKSIMSLINGNSISNLSNIEKIKKEYKVEYWLAHETCLIIARIISNGLFILMAYTNSNLIILLFVLFLILFANNSVKLQKVINEEKKQV